MSYTIEQIEDAIVDALHPLKASLGVRTIKSYQAELDSEDELARAVRLFPAILCVYGGSEYADHGSRKVETMSWLLFACDKNLRAEGEARKGGAGNPGTYKMLNSARDLLYGKQLSLQIFPLELIREKPVYLGMGLSVYSAEYETAQALLYAGD
jgi:phage gp37-like protein